MTAAQKALDALEAARDQATQRQLATINLGCVAALREDGQHLYAATHPAFNADVRYAVASVNLAAPLAAVVRAAMEYRVHRIEFGSTVGATYRDVRQSRNKLDAALDAFAAAAQEMFP